MPIFTSCCPAWVKYAEQFFPELLPNLSTCMSPQSMMGSIIKKDEADKKHGKNVVVVSIMPCVAKKYEVSRPELSRQGKAHVDYSLTTAELASMIEEAGIRFENLQAGSMDMPFGFATGAGVIFGDAGGVAEAVARYVGAPLSAMDGHALNFADEIAGGGIRTAQLKLGEKELTVVSVQGLANAKIVARSIVNGTRKADIIEVMACPGGCVGGAGQPISHDGDIVIKRKKGMRDADGSKELRTTNDNPFINAFYSTVLRAKPGLHEAHELLHTSYTSKKRIQDTSIALVKGSKSEKVSVKVCVGTSCFLRGSQAVLRDILAEVEREGLSDFVDVSATFCSEQCDKGPTVHIGGVTIHKADVNQVMALVKPKIKDAMLV